MSEPLGIIYPPPELKAIVDSTAKYVAKNGKAFEEKIKRDHKDKPKFSFLLCGDPFNAYYQHKVKEIRYQLLENLESTINNNNDSQDDSQKQETQQHPQQQAIDTNRVSQRDGEGEQSSAQHSDGQVVEYHPPPTFDGRDGEFNDSRQTQNHDPQDTFGDNIPRVRMKLNDYIQEMTMKLEEPPPLNYLATSAPNLSHMDCEVIKLTSQFIATYGRPFLLELVSREQNNSQFDFLKPQHGQFSYMSNLIMQYALIQNQPLDILEQLDKDANSQKHVLDKIKMRSDWDRMLELEEKKREEVEEKEKLLYSQIDWHDFVIVETIDYQPDEVGAFSPTTADQVGTRLLLQQRNEEQNVPVEMDIDMDVESDEGENSNEGDPQHVLQGSENIVIREDYDPKSASKVTQPDNFFVSQITNERVPIDKIHEHVRYNLFDPRYLEKKEKMIQEKKNEDAVFATGSQIQNSLKSLAERRTDIFGLSDKETAIGRRIGDEEQNATKDDRLIWDGHKSSLKKKKLG